MESERAGNPPPPGIPRLRGAHTALLAKRREQKGRHTLGDDLDRALLAALRDMPGDHAAAQDARACGLDIGAHVYSRRFSEDNVPGAVAILSTSLLESGLGTLRLDESFHRRARVSYMPSLDASSAPAPVRAALLEGLLEGFLAEAFNCQARATARAETEFDVELLEGRDVNQAYDRRRA